jgi:hypothetical protein
MTLPSDSPLITADDLPVHQTAETLRRTDTLHPRWTERWYFNLQNEDGRLLGIVGGGFYPNNDVLEVYACLLDGDQQHNLRQRVRSTDRGRLDTAERVRFAVTDPMLAWSFAVDGPSFALDLRYQATTAPHLFPPFVVAADLPGDATSGEYDAIQHFVQPGTLTGSIDGHDVEGLLSFRDRTWGVRSNRPRLHNWFVCHLPAAQYLTLIHQERADGRCMVSHAALVAADGATTRLILDDHDLSFDAASRLLRSARYRGHDQTGRRFTLDVENSGPGVRLLGAGYTGTQGDEGVPSGFEHETWDLSDPAVSTRFGRGTIDSPATMEFAWADGERAQGFGVTESAIARNHWRYGSQLR